LAAGTAIAPTPRIEEAETTTPAISRFIMLLSHSLVVFALYPPGRKPDPKVAGDWFESLTLRGLGGDISREGPMTGAPRRWTTWACLGSYVVRWPFSRSTTRGEVEHRVAVEGDGRALR